MARTERITPLRIWHSILFKLTLAVTVVGSASCVCPDNFEFEEPPQFNPRVRRDRNGLTPEQQRADPGLGPYRDGGNRVVPDLSEVVSDVQPDLPEAVQEKLLQSDCYWTATGENESEPIDLLKLNWEVAVAFPIFPTSGTLGLCRFTHPITGDPATICQEYFDENPEADSDINTGYYLGGFEGRYFSAPEECGPLLFDEDRDDYFVLLQAVSRSEESDDCPLPGPQPAPDAASDPLRGGLLFKHRLQRFDGAAADLSPANAFDIACGVDRTVAPVGDASYRLVLPQPDPTIDDIVEWVGPNILTVPGERTIRRRMEHVPQIATGRYRWQTPIFPEDAGAEMPAQRWHENFSPNALVESVRVYKLVDDALQVAAAPGARLELTGFGRGGGMDLPFTWRCAGQDEGDATSYSIYRQDGVEDCDLGIDPDQPIVVSREGATPTYALSQLQDAGDALRRPAEWQVETLGVDHGTEEVFIELTLKAQAEGAFIKASLTADLGETQVGTSSGGLMTFENVGGNAVRIDQIQVSGVHASEFVVQPVGEPILLPAPIEAVPLAAGYGYELAVIPGHASLPYLFTTRNDLAGQMILVEADNHGGGTETFYGEPVSFSHGIPSTASASPQFNVAPATADAVLPFGRQAYPSRTVPFTLPATKSFHVAVTATPQGWGDRVATVHVSFHQLSDPSVTGAVGTAVIVDGVSGPTASAFPPTIQIPAGDQRDALLSNSGNLAMVRGSVSITGPDAQWFQLISAHSPSLAMDPGDVEMFRVAYAPGVLPAFSWPHQAQLEVGSNAVNGSPSVYQLLGVTPLAADGELRFEGDTRDLPAYLGNVSSHDVERRDLYLSGPDSNLFSLLQQPTSWQTLSPGETEYWWVHYTPQCTLPAPPSGYRQAQLNVDTDHGTLVVPLLGDWSINNCP